MKNILIVDDQAGWRNYNSSVVRKILGEDTIIDTASSAGEGYTKLLESRENPYDYMLTDMQMETDYLPEMAGEWLIEQAQNLSFCYRTKIAIISASPHIKYIAEKYNVDYIPKSSAVSSLDKYKSFLE